MQDYKKLKVWEKTHLLTLAVYRLTGTFPEQERFGLISQMRRSASSIPTNITEGCRRDSNADFLRFLHVAMGSSNELEYQLLLAHDLGFIDRPSYTALEQQVIEAKKMLVAFIKQVRA
jgi:four helix bundle protein